MCSYKMRKWMKGKVVFCYFKLCKLRHILMSTCRSISCSMEFHPRSQDQFLEVQDPQKVGLLNPKSGLFEPQAPLKPSYNNPIFGPHFVT